MQGSALDLDADDALVRVSGTVIGGCLDDEVLDIDDIIDVGELRDGPLDRLVPVPIVLGVDPNPVGGVIVLLKLLRGAERLDGDDRLDDDEAKELVVDEIWAAANVTEVSELDVLMGGPQGACGVGAGAGGTPVVPDCIVPGA